ncbi:short-chain dehydrogenase reductase family 42E member 1 isoform X1 [Pelobates cultripes]|uniref:Short-chain dehydrogenase reductase family 42E member 1 isoform X1 n=1 Tax=Pelobates cultripes TaxID=61616 RepID=A0AAD1TDK2_PELCU|nr:short-chain dehydrogenase reductase family 42E member 1 isoform X1 [Pelobates cultripes]
MGISQSPTETVLITGGGGYFGHRLGCKLHQKGVNVILFDIQKPVLAVPEGIRFIQGDIRSTSALENALTDVSCVFHTASYGMSGREQLQTRKIEEINVNGTNNLIQACINKGVGRLVYTSTFNVVFGGQEINDGDESLPYLPLHLHPDNYSRTKSIAEMIVLKANDSELKNGYGCLKTCALRSAGIYGPGEQRHLPRIIGYLETGRFKYLYGDPKNLVQFVHVDNLVLSHILAAKALTPDKNYVAAGQPYFISDGTPINNFEFFRPFVEGLGYKFPTIRLPLFLVYFIAFITEWIHFLISPIYNFQPLLTRTEVYKTGVTHYFSIEKAKRDLGYEPQGHNMHEVAEWFKSHGYSNQARKVKNRSYIWDILFVLLFLLVILSWIPRVGSATY